MSHQPQGLALVPVVFGGDEGPIVDTWWQIETGARDDRPAPGVLH